MPLFITEYMDLAKDRGGNFIAAGMEPCITDQAGITVSGTSAQSAVFNEKTAFVMIHAQEASCLKFGTNPTAVNTGHRIGAGETRFYGVPPNKSFRVAAVVGV